MNDFVQFHTWHALYKISHLTWNVCTAHYLLEVENKTNYCITLFKTKKLIQEVFNKGWKCRLKNLLKSCYQRFEAVRQHLIDRWRVMLKCNVLLCMLALQWCLTLKVFANKAANLCSGHVQLPFMTLCSLLLLLVLLFFCTLFALSVYSHVWQCSGRGIVVGRLCS